MAYTAIINTLKGDHYKIEISGAGSGELLLSGSDPVVIQYECDDLFKPLKMSGCSVRVLTAQPLLDLYTGQLNNITLKVYSGTCDNEGTFSSEGMIWFGFLSPNVYSSPYDDVLDEMTLEFVDPLSAMESVKYARRNTGQWRSFLTYFTEGMKLVQGLAWNAVNVGVLSGLNYSLSNSKVSETILTQLGVMERNFVDETDDDDNAMTYQEVLEHICRYLNVQAVCYGDTLYFVDTLASQTNKAITNDTIAESGVTLSMGEMYNRVTVIESTNPIDEVLYQNILGYDDIQDSVMLKTWMGTNAYYDADVGCYKAIMGYDGEHYIDLRGLYRPKSISGWTMLGDSAYILGIADVNTNAMATYSMKTGADQLIDKGSCVLYDTNYNVKTVPTKLSFDKSVLFYYDTSTLYTSVPQTIPSKYQFDEYGEANISTPLSVSGLTDTVFMRYNKTNHSLVMRGGYIILAFKYKYLVSPQTSLEQEHNDVDITAGSFYQKVGGLDSSGRDVWKLKLKIGNKYWNGSSWTTSDSWFQVSHTWENEEKLFNNEKSLDNTNTYLIRLGEDISGYAIPVGDNELFGDVLIEVCAPSVFGHGWVWTKYTRVPTDGDEGAYIKIDDDFYAMRTSEHFPTPVGCVQMTEFKLAYSTQKKDDDSLVLDTESNDDDIKITGTANAANILDMNDVEMNVNTWSSIQNSYSYVIQKTGDNMTYHVPEVTPEKELISRLLGYYGKPMLNVSCKIWSSDVMPWSNCTIQTFAGKKFAVGGIVYNLASDNAEVQLLEID